MSDGALRQRIESVCSHALWFSENVSSSDFMQRAAIAAAVQAAIHRSPVPPDDPLYVAFCALERPMKRLVSLVQLRVDGDDAQVEDCVSALRTAAAETEALLRSS